MIDRSFEISDRAAQYLAVQRLGFEGYTSRVVWSEAYKNAIFDLYENIADFLPKKCESVLDIGSGLGGIDILIDRHYGGGVHLHLLDGEDDEPIVNRHALTFSSKEVALQFLAANGASAASYRAPGNLSPNGKVDLVISFASWCFHYPPEEYLDFVKSCCRTGTVLILDVRRWKPGWFATLGENFKHIATAGEFPKFVRWVYEA